MNCMAMLTCTQAKAALTVYYAAQRIPIHTIYACY